MYELLRFKSWMLNQTKHMCWIFGVFERCWRLKEVVEFPGIEGMSWIPQRSSVAHFSLKSREAKISEDQQSLTRQTNTRKSFIFCWMLLILFPNKSIYHIYQYKYKFCAVPFYGQVHALSHIKPIPGRGPEPPLMLLAWWQPPLHPILCVSALCNPSRPQGAALLSPYVVP